MSAEQLWEAIQEADAQLVSDLLKDGASPETPTESGDTPLYAASLGGDVDLIRILAAAGADPNRESLASDQGLPICAAACWKHVDAVRTLLVAGADPNLPEDQGTGYTPLTWAVQNDDAETIRVLLDGGADPNQHVYGRTPLAMAQDLGRRVAAEILAAHGAVAERTEERPGGFAQ